ncbi:MAG TPA: hypothetical protein VLJ80_05375 [Solirubrobacteraceae bacterium]|nr:hypothetical protein [Solirubrobacteraceae bacterium]
MLHQTLHGYRNGHRLLASSVSLPRADQEVMLGLSDTADFRYLPSPTRLLSGYPLPDQNFYVLATTWPAPEQRRPGCVWTHSLLVDVSDLGDMRFPDSLLGLYRRPDVAETDFLASFSVPLDYRDAPTPDLGGIPDDLLQTLVWAIYEPPPRPVAAVELPVDVRDAERLLLRFWGQQWPELRRTFSFAEAVTPRHVGDKVFDVQFAEIRQRRTSGDLSGVRLVHGVPNVRVPDWCAVASDDLRCPGALTRFLEMYGPEVGASRPNLATLAQIWTTSRQERPSRAEDLVRLFGSAFPGGTEASGLRVALFGPVSGRSVADDLSIMLALLTAPQVAGASFKQLDLPSRAAVAAETVSGTAALLNALVDNPSRSRVAGAVVAGLASSADPDGVELALTARDDSLAPLVRRQPRIATIPSVWTSANDQAEIWHALGESRPARSLRTEIIDVIFEVEATIDRADLVERWPDAAATVLERLSRDTEAPSTAAWLSVLSPSQVTEWLSSHRDVDLLNALASVWAPDALVSVPERIWLECSWDPQSVGDEQLVRVYVASLQWLTSEKGILAAKIFDRLFPMAVSGQLDAASLAALEALTPDISKAPPGRKVARALNRVLRKATSPTAAFLVTHHDGFAQILTEDRARGLARGLAERVAADPTVATAWQRAIIEKTAAKSQKGGLVKTVEDAIKVVRKLG